MVEALAQAGAVAVLSEAENRGPARALRRDRRRALQADRPSRRRADARVHARDGARADRARQGARDRRRRARRARDAHFRGRRGEDDRRANGRPVSITGLGCHVPDRVLTNADLETARRHDRTSGSWSAPASASGGSRAEDEALSDIALPAARDALEQARARRRDVDLIIVATVTPDMMFPATSAILADQLGIAGRRGLRPFRRLHRASCTRSRRPTGWSPPASRSARSSSAATYSRRSSTGPTARRSCCSATAPGRSCSRRVESGGFLGFELGADGGGGEHLWLPGSGSRISTTRALREDERPRGLQVRDARDGSLRGEAILEECGRTVDDVDVYVPHQANVRIIDHATEEARSQGKSGHERRPLR